MLCLATCSVTEQKDSLVQVVADGCLSAHLLAALAGLHNGLSAHAARLGSKVDALQNTAQHSMTKALLAQHHTRVHVATHSNMALFPEQRRQEKRKGAEARTCCLTSPEHLVT